MSKNSVKVRTADEANVSQLEDTFVKCDSAMEDLRDEFDEREEIFFGKTSDEVTNNVAKSRAYDPILSTIVIERAARVMAQAPSGKVQALDSADRGKSMLMGLILEKYVKPNANAQFPHEVKLRNWDIYSLIYGSMPMLVDYVVSDRYVGPDSWLIPIRQYYPQPGIYQISDMDYVYVDSFVSLGWLSERDKKTWKNIDKLIDRVKESEGQKKSSYVHRSYAEEKWGNSDYGGKGKDAQILIRTRYENDRWITYAPEYHLVLRDFANPHKNDKLPIIIKETLPLLDRVMGLGEVERGKPLQYTANSLLNLFLDGIKYSIFPPTIINPTGVIPTSIKMEPAAQWFETVQNSIRTHNFTPQGINSFQSAYPFIKGALLSQAGTTDTTISSNVDPSLGKTPDAVKLTAARESSRDNWDRKMMEQATEELYDRFVNLIAVRQEKPIELGLFKGEIEKIQAIYPDVAEMFESGEYGKVTVDPDMIGGTDYKYFIDSGTSMAKDTALENQALTGILTMMMKSPAIIQGMQTRGKDVDMAEMIKRWVATSGITDWEKIIVDFQPQEAGMGAGMGGEMGQGGMDMSQFTDPTIRQAAEAMFGGGNPAQMSQMPTSNPLQGA